MCGIVGYLGEKNTKEILLDGLKELEYRGYDSAGIAVLQDGQFSNYKAIGKLVNLEEKTKDFTTQRICRRYRSHSLGYSWKTNRTKCTSTLGESSYVVHNGIIENYAELKKELIADGVTFLSQTDTEVIVHQFEKNLQTQN